MVGEREIRVESAEKKQKNRKIIALLAGGLLLTASLLYFYFHIYRVVPAFSEITCEYGEPISQNITDYLSGTDWSVHLGELDLSLVDREKTGTYEAMAYHGRTQFTYTVIIQDTVAPEILWKKGQVYLAVNTTCTVDDVIEGVADADAQAQAFFFREGTALTEIRFDQVGEYSLEILARDRAGNETWGQVSVVVDTPPVLEGIHNFYVIPGSTPDYLETVEAWDEIDGDLTEQIRVDDSRVELDKAGIYSLRYLVEDDYGLTVVRNAKVTVAEPDEIQELIGKRQINYREDIILGAPNVYDAGASRQENIMETLDYMRPALVQLYHPTGGGGYSSGSGYIVEITEDTIYICSNRHVVEKYEDWDVYFFDGTKLSGKTLGIGEGYDVGVATVALEDVPQELLSQLMTVHIDKTYWEKLDQQELVLALERVDRTGGLIHTTMGNLIKIKQDFYWYEQLYHTEVTVELVQGDSGSALLDGYGNLICMAYAFSTDPTRYWCVPLDGILDSYEEITGRMPYVY